MSDADAAIFRRHVALLEEHGHMLRMPHSRALGEGLFELRFNCDHHAQRITYSFVPERRVITLTHFVKTKMNEREEVARARRALKAVDYEAI